MINIQPIKQCPLDTPLHHCMTINGSIATLEMAKMLIMKGAEVNTINRNDIMPFGHHCRYPNVSINPIFDSKVGAKAF